MKSWCILKIYLSPPPPQSEIEISLSLSKGKSHARGFNDGEENTLTAPRSSRACARSLAHAYTYVYTPICSRSTLGYFCSPSLSPYSSSHMSPLLPSPPRGKSSLPSFNFILDWGVSGEYSPYHPILNAPSKTPPKKCVAPHGWEREDGQGGGDRSSPLPSSPLRSSPRPR